MNQLLRDVESVLGGPPSFKEEMSWCIYSGSTSPPPSPTPCIISCVIFLDSGSNLWFNYNNKLIKGSKGKLVIFPSHFIYSNKIFNQNKNLFILNHINIQL